jgi:hypothetical protein
MAANAHPSSMELLAALRDAARADVLRVHLEQCVACRVRQSRIQREEGIPDTAGTNSIARIVAASTPLPQVLAGIVTATRHGSPQPNEVWRVGRDEALLVWVRRIFDDGVADVIPVVLDTELADQETVLMEANATPLGVEAAVMVALRTHIDLDAFLNPVGVVDIGKQVNELMTAVEEGRRPSGVAVGPVIRDDDDQRLEYRQALRDLLAELSPSAWQSRPDGSAAPMGPVAHMSDNDTTGIKNELGERLPGVKCFQVPQNRAEVLTSVEATAVLKVTYLDTAVLVVTLCGDNLVEFPDIRAIAGACRQLCQIESDADAAAVALPNKDWQAILLTTAHMREAYQVPGGESAGPTATMRGYSLVETLFKHLDEFAMTSWPFVEPATATTVGPTNLHKIATHHAQASIERITAQGKRTVQPAKRTAWSSLPGDFEERVARFIIAVANEESLSEALSELTAEGHDA